ncbi:MAG: lamin tail domain-containing protein [Deltaproteobacteria bacterium]|nr:lamin tail domain-containing protein [Deltaproteobacteria bacterium]
MRRFACATAIALGACGGESGGGVDAVVAVDTAPMAPDAGSAVGTLFINEVMTSNTTACPDPYGEYDDWVELYNASDAPIDLTGYTVTDDAGQPTKFTIGSGVVVPAHGYGILWCDDQISQGHDHIAFKLASGEAFVIYAPGGDMIDSVAFGTTATDVSFARLPDGTGEFASCALGTCGKTNGTTCAASVR